MNNLKFYANIFQTTKLRLNVPKNLVQVAKWQSNEVQTTIYTNI